MKGNIPTGSLAPPPLTLSARNKWGFWKAGQVCGETDAEKEGKQDRKGSGGVGTLIKGRACGWNWGWWEMEERGWRRTCVTAWGEIGDLGRGYGEKEMQLEEDWNVMQ